jgi:single-stranded DNA-binding protein
LGKEPETKYAQSGLQIANFSLATTDSVKKGDEWENKTEWHNVTCFGKTHAFLHEYATVERRMQGGEVRDFDFHFEKIFTDGV